MKDNTSLRNSQQQLLNMLNSIGEGIYCVDLQGNCTYTNNRCVEILGFQSEEELLGQNMHNLIHHHFRDGSEYHIEDCKIYQAYRKGRSVHVEDEVFWRKDGSSFEAEYWSYPIQDGDTVVGAVVNFIDVTVRRTEELHNQHLAQLVEHSKDAIIGKDLHGVILSWNQGAKQIYGYDAEEAIGETIKMILPDDQQTEEPEIIEAISQRRELSQFEVRRKRKSGEFIDVSVTVSLVYDGFGECIGYSSIERDVTERRRSQDAIHRAITAAETAESIAKKANNSRAEFLANVSHELRTPMNAILGMLSLALDEKLDPVVLDYLKTAKGSADSLLELVNELLDFAKIESGNFEIHNEPFDIRVTVDSPAKALAAPSSEKGLEILCEVDSQIPANLIGDARRIQQVITNLLSNSVKFTDAGEIVVGVSLVRRLPAEVRLKFSVTDTGIGIKPEDQSKVFLPFKQADMSSTRQFYGTGLGLSICRELVALMGGKLKMKSKPGVGTRFWFELTLPIDDNASPEEKLPAEKVAGLKVLIVDDNPTNLRILEKIFVNWSMQPIVCDNAQQALNIVNELQNSEHDISLAVVDGLMPEVDGFELAKRVKQNTGKNCFPIVMMQAAADLAILAEKKADAPIDYYLTKPVSQSELLNAVVETLDLYSHPQHRSYVRGIQAPVNIESVQANILLVEDLPANQKVATAILQKRGHHVTVASNGRVAVDKVQSSESEFDLVLMDIQMPVMDGIQATAAIRALNDPKIAEIPIIAMTAHAMQGDRETCLAAGMDAYIAKPLDANRLIELVESIASGESYEEGFSTSSHSKSVDQKAEKTPASLVEYESSIARLGGDQELFVEFIEIFQADAPSLLAQLEEAIVASNGAGIRQAAHALKGLMSNFGAEKCCEVAQAIETAGRDNDIATANSLIRPLKDLYQQLCDELKDYQ